MILKYFLNGAWAQSVTFHWNLLALLLNCADTTLKTGQISLSISFIAVIYFISNLRVTYRVTSFSTFIPELSFTVSSHICDVSHLPNVGFHSPHYFSVKTVLLFLSNRQLHFVLFKRVFLSHQYLVILQKRFQHELQYSGAECDDEESLLSSGRTHSYGCLLFENSHLYLLLLSAQSYTPQPSEVFGKATGNDLSLNLHQYKQQLHCIPSVIL